MGDLHPFEWFQVTGIIMVIIAILQGNYSGITSFILGILGFMTFAFGTYFWGAEKSRRKVELEEGQVELMNGYQSSMTEYIQTLNDICGECDCVDYCKSHDPHAGCETEAREIRMFEILCQRSD